MTDREIRKIPNLIYRISKLEADRKIVFPFLADVELYLNIIYNSFGDDPETRLFLLGQLTADQTNANAVANTMETITDLSFPVLANEKYYFKYFIRYASAALTTGSRWALTGPASPTTLLYRSTYLSSGPTEVINPALTAYDTPASATATSPSLTDNIATLEGLIQPSADGTVAINFASSVSASGITAKTGSFYQSWKLPL